MNAYEMLENAHAAQRKTIHQLLTDKKALRARVEQLEADNMELQSSEHVLPGIIADRAAEAMRAKCEEIAREGSFPFDIEVWRVSTKKEMTALVAVAIADAIAALKAK